MASIETKGHGAVESWLVSAGRDRRPGSPLNVPPYPASNFVPGGDRAYARDDGTPGWAALEPIVGGLQGGSSVAFASGMAAIAAVLDALPAGAVVALPDDCYQGVVALAGAVCAGVQLIQHATSLGAVESTIERRAGVPGQEHLPPTLLRLSVGIEDVEDLWADLDRALRNARPAQQ